MSATDEHSALDHPVSLFEYARRLHLLTPQGPLPDGGQPLPDSGDHPNTPSSERKQALLTVLREFISNPALSPQDLHEQCTHLAFGARAVTRTLQELAPEVSPRLLQTARWLVMNGTDRRAVLLGLGLFDGNAEQSDADSIGTIGLLRFAERPAIEALAKIPTAVQDLIWLAVRSRNHSRTVAAVALAGHPDPAVRQWVLSTPRDLLSSDLARQIAERYSLAETLGRPVVDDRTWDQLGNLLLAMTSTRNYRYEINRYDQAAVAYQRWVALAGTRPATLERAALLTMIAEDLRTGPAAPVACGIRQDLIDQINDVLTSAPWTDMLNRSAGADDPVEADLQRATQSQDRTQRGPARRGVLHRGLLRWAVRHDRA